MNSISSYIHKKDIATANDYLSRFAKLMRMILNLAAKPRIFIADEIELLELYINTEAMRFEKKFSYEVSVDDALDPEEILVPTMILQPFVENAIWHGLAGKGEAGRIQIRFEKQDNQLVCSVEDNGRGRPAEGTKKPGGHESKALGITARRLSLLEEETGVKSFYEIIDLKTADGEPAGTRVEVHLPLMDE
jgi:sensor histidine kinase YesM